jgi:hypothetical protein
MKHKINIFRHNPPFDDIPIAKRWDRDRNAKLLNIVFAGATFGNFLKYFTDKFSQKTPDILKEPFTATGTSHNVGESEYSGLIQKYHQQFINDNEGQEGLPVCIILPSTEKHFLYLKMAQFFRAGDYKLSTDDLWQKAIGEMPDWQSAMAKDIIKLYDIKETAHFSWLPKFIVRDWYKLEFLQDLEDTYSHQWFHQFETHPFFKKQKVFHLDLETFFDWETFIENITELNDFFDLSLDFGRQQEMKQIFDKGVELDQIRQESSFAEQVVEYKTEGSLQNLCVATQGWIYAQVEKTNKDIPMPLNNRFFRDTEEIRQFIEYYPNWYRRPNPNIK